MSPSSIATEFARLLTFAPSDANAVVAWSVVAVCLCVATPVGLVRLLRRGARSNEESLARGLLLRGIQNAEALRAGRKDQARTLINRCGGDRKKLAELMAARPWIKDHLR